MILRNREIKKIDEIEEIIHKSDICHLAMVEGDKPYCLPFNFAYENKCLYLHCDNQGKKLGVIANNKNVFVNFTIDYELFYRHKEVACSWGMKYRSVNAAGKIFEIDDYDEKYRIMNLFMEKYAGESYEFNAPAIKNVKVFGVEFDEMTGKKYGY